LYTCENPSRSEVQRNASCFLRKWRSLSLFKFTQLCSSYSQSRTFGVLSATETSTSHRISSF
jgi:hypothetical protein